MDSSERISESVLLTEEQHHNLLKARKAMYEDAAEGISLAHTISVLAKQETARTEEQ